MINFLILVLFAIGYIAIALEQHTKVNKTAIALLLAVLCWALAIIKFHHADAVLLQLEEHLTETAQVIIFLMGAMTIVKLIDSYHAFRIVTRFIQTHSRRRLLWIISIITFFLSSVLDNLTTSIIMVSLSNRLIKERRYRLLFASMIIIAANAGGAWTPIGDVTTIMLWIGGRVTSGTLLRLLFFPSLISMLIPLLYFSFSVTGTTEGNSKKDEDHVLMPGGNSVFILGIGALVFVPILKALTGLPPYMGILVGMGVLWVVTDLIHKERSILRVPHILAKVDMSSILFFLGILLAVSALETTGILRKFTMLIDTYFKNKDVAISIVGLMSSIIGNVPVTAASMHMYDIISYPIDSKLWQMIAYCVGTGGSLLIIGSAAGLVVMGTERISFMWYLKKVSLPVLVGYIAGIIVFVFLYSL